MLSRITILWILFIFSSSFFMRQVMRLIVENFGRGIIAWLIWLSFLIMAYLFVRLTIKHPYNSLCFLVIFSIGMLYAASFSIVEERVHLVKFGILGWLIAHDFWTSLRERVVVRSVILAFVVATIDETIQYFLPYRVGDLRDVASGTIGGVWGGVLYCASQTKFFQDRNYETQ